MTQKLLDYLLNNGFDKLGKVCYNGVVGLSLSMTQKLLDYLLNNGFDKLGKV